MDPPVPPPAAPLPPADAVSLPPSSPPPEETLFQGRVSLWLGFRSLAGAALAAVVGFAWWIWSLFQSGSLASYSGLYLGLPLGLAGLLMLLYVWLKIRALRYKITTRLIEREMGILVKRVDSLDLSRVKDVELVQSLPQRMLRIGTLEVYSSDRTDPLLILDAIPHPRPVYEKLRDAVIQISQRRGVIPLDR
jgi:membrane protein YdbS with pleckstrin-like domain